MAAIDPGLRAGVARKRKEELEVANLANKVLSNKFGDVGDSLPAPPGADGAQASRPPKTPKAKKGDAFQKQPLQAPGKGGKS